MLHARHARQVIGRHAQTVLTISDGGRLGVGEIARPVGEIRNVIGQWRGDLEITAHVDVTQLVDVANTDTLAAGQINAQCFGAVGLTRVGKTNP